MKELIFATNNKHKLSEVRPLLEGKVLIHSLSEIGLEGDIPETADTLEGNALQKAMWVYQRTGRDCFADDTGLEVDALGGAPGVYSARYAGEGCSFNDNMNKLLAALQGVKNRQARFRTVVCLLQNGQPHYFEGWVEGHILTEKHGTEGFGYDPIFQPNESNVPFAEMDMQTKNKISHRGRAMTKLIEYLKQ